MKKSYLSSYHSSLYWQDEVDGFIAHVVQIGGCGSRVFARTALLLIELGYLNADKFISVGFTRVGDMLVAPREGFEIVDYNSPSGNTIGAIGLPKSCLLILEDKLKNEIKITCKKTTSVISDPN